ncbi:hypothetical protein PC120_g15692 [Phytophthora cactorum]|nr:hypothetical protein PC120_g15692 [Phytophthora cactorum]
MDPNEFPHLNDAQLESIRKVAGIFGMNALQSLAAATPAEQVERVNAFDAYERGLIAHANPYEEKEGESLHFWVQEVELAMEAALITSESLRVEFALSNLSGRAKSWAYTREATSPGCFASWAHLCEQLRAAFLPANYEYRQRPRFLSCKHVRRELHEYIQVMRVLTASLVGNPLPENFKMTMFIDGLKVGLARTQLFRVQASTLEEVIQVALQEEYSHLQARTPAAAWPRRATLLSRGASSGPVPMQRGLA